jgi:hypothetical protein
MTFTPRVSVLAACLVAGVSGCKTDQAQLDVVIPVIDGGACSAYTDIACVNYLEFRVRTATASTSRCVELDFVLADLCDVGRLADGRELFKLPPDTQLPITVEGKRVFPAGSCGSNQCDKVIFRGTTGEGRLGDYVGRPLALTLNMVGSCGESEEFFLLPDGGTCAGVCGGQNNVLCDQVAGGCLCRPRMDGGQGGID